MSQDTKNVKTDQLGDCVELSAKTASITDVFVVREGVGSWTKKEIVQNSGQGGRERL